MRIKGLKKVLAATLAATMVMASALTVCATTSDAGSGSEPVQEEQEPVRPATYAEQRSQSANATISVGGTATRTSVSGVYAATSVQGCAVTTSASDVRAELGLESGQRAKIIIYDTDQNKSVNAMASVNAACDAMGGNMVAVLTIDLGATQDGRWVTLSSGSVGMKTGLPKDADTTRIYSVICVQPGGVVTILEDQDTDPKTVTFAVQAGLGTYALVAE